MTEKREGTDSFSTLHDMLSKAMKEVEKAGSGSFVKMPSFPRDPFELWSQMLVQPVMFAQFWLELTTQFQREGLSWWKETLQRTLGQGSDVQEGVPASVDRRFRGESWSTIPAFDFIKRSYLMVSEAMQRAADGVPLEGEAKERVQFATQSFVDAMSPSNFAATNPEVLQEAVKTGGKSLFTGLQNLLQDVKQGRMTLTDETDFEVGRNLALTPGAVVYQNRLFQLIQYAPTTESVHQRPLLIVPPCINKYYILDLKESNSFVKWLTEQGHTVFIVSWVNATPVLRDAGWSDFVSEGVIEAIEAVRAICEEDTINLVAWCIGGTLSASALSVLSRRGLDYVASASFLTTLLDFSDPGEVRVFLTPEEVAKRSAMCERDGVFSGKQMAIGFNMLRANDLIWSYVVNNYLKGKTPPPFDLLYWNSDPTNLPASMYNEYINDMYLENKLIQKDAISVDGTPVDLGMIRVPCYFFSAINDHIAPWKATYEGAKHVSGPRTFVLGGSGHIAGVVNHPAKNKRDYRTCEALPSSPEEWLDGAELHCGSWWPHWNEWVQGFVGATVAARHELGGKEYPVLEPAPGSYVQVNCDDIR